MTTISNMDDIIDSRDVIARIEELTEARANEPNVRARKRWDKSDDGRELAALKKLAAQGENSADDWSYGECLIRHDQFTAHIEELIDDCYEMPKAFKSNEWPYRHMKIDYEAAAEEAKQDYTEVDFDGVAYFIR